MNLSFPPFNLCGWNIPRKTFKIYYFEYSISIFHRTNMKNWRNQLWRKRIKNTFCVSHISLINLRGIFFDLLIFSGLMAAEIYLANNFFEWFLFGEEIERLGLSFRRNWRLQIKSSCSFLKNSTKLCTTAWHNSVTPISLVIQGTTSSLNC